MFGIRRWGMPSSLPIRDKGAIRIAVSPRDGQILVTVSDSGLGMPPEQLGKVFEKFFQVECERATGHSSGLGLTFCKLAIEAHGGDIGVTSTSTDGSEF